MTVRARCRHYNAYGVRCEARIPEQRKFCDAHRTKETRRLERLRLIAEREHLRQEKALRAYRARIDPGQLPLDGA